MSDVDDDAADLADDVRWLALCRAVGRDVVSEASWTRYDDINALRESLIRQRLSAAAERQAHDSRGYVLDWSCDPVTGAGQIIAATPTGDKREERELLIDAVTAIETVRASATRDLQNAAIVAFLVPWLLSD
jgi:hypothetical protein